MRMKKLDIICIISLKVDKKCYIIPVRRIMQMIIDNIIVIVVAIILITYLSINYVKKYAPGNLILISITAFSLGLYLPIVFYNVYLINSYFD